MTTRASPTTRIRYEVTAPSGSYYTESKDNALKYAKCLLKAGNAPERIKITEITEIWHGVAVPKANGNGGGKPKAGKSKAKEDASS